MQEKKYQIIARKYRPQRFLDVVGQNAAVTTLKNAIRLNKSAHAYLFSGSRGIGKTTLARIFAKALNCENLSSDFEPCNQCRSCQEITNSNSMDVIEIDGASNRGIDDIRQINETIGYAASSGRYKIYIIDEVHMLTKEAFNALLKTLEEPPAKTKFFFATTEPHKVPPTILSRTQRFDLIRISLKEIEKQLLKIATDMGREIDPEALFLIANFSEGSLRDAESLLDQLFCYEEGIITPEIINKTIGLIPQEIFFELDEAIYNQDISFPFSFVEKIYESGKDFSHLLDELTSHFRHILLAKTSSPQLSALSDRLRERYLKTADFYTKDQCLYILDYLIQSPSKVQKSSLKRVSVEMILLHLIQSKNRLPLSSVIQKLIEMEKKLSSPDGKNLHHSQTSSSPSLAAPPPFPSSPIKPAPLLSEKNSYQEPINQPSPTHKPQMQALNPPFSSEKKPKEPTPLEKREEKPPFASPPIPPTAPTTVTATPIASKTMQSPAIEPQQEKPLEKNIPFTKEPNTPNSSPSLKEGKIITPLSTPAVELEEVPFSLSQKKKELRKPPSPIPSPPPAAPLFPSSNAPFPQEKVPSNTPPTTSTPMPSNVENKNHQKKEQSHYDTMLNFASVELDGIIKMDY